MPMIIDSKSTKGDKVESAQDIKTKELSNQALEDANKEKTDATTVNSFNQAIDS